MKLSKKIKTFMAKLKQAFAAPVGFADKDGFQFRRSPFQ